MAGGFKLSLIPDVAPFVAGMAKAEQALDDTADALDDLARDAQRKGREAGQDIGKGIDAGTDKASDSVDDLTATFREMAKAGQRASKDTGDDIGKNVKRGTDEASDGVDEFKDEANSTAREVAASFDGSAESIAGGFQEVAANALAGFGPLGAVAGLALAAGIGTFWKSFQENAEKAEQRVSSMYQDMLESGQQFVSREFIADEINKIYDSADDAVVKVNELKDLAERTKIAEPLLARALVGDEDARKEVKSEIARQRLAINETLDEATARGSNMAPALSPAIEALRDVEDRLSGVSDGFTEAQSNAAAARAAIDGITAPTEGVARSAEDAMSKFDGLGRSISSLPNPTVTVKVTADTTDAQRTIARLTNGSYEVRVNGRVAGMRYE